MTQATFRDVSALLHPRSVAIVGASQQPDSWPARVYRNLRSFGFPGPVYPINPRYDELYGTRCYPSLTALPEPADHLVVVVRAAQLPAVLEEAGQRGGCRSATIFTGGFSEAGTAEGRALEDSVRSIAERYGIRISGPNCLGNVSMPGRLVTYSEQTLENFRPGSFAFVTQSSGVMGAVLRYAGLRGVGISYGIAAGNEVNTDVVDYLHFLVQDEHTRFIGLFLEGLRRPEAFLTVCEQLARANKPVAVLKAGRSSKGQEAALAHTAVLAGSYQVFEAAAERYGLIPVDSLDGMVELAELATRVSFPRPDGLVAASLSGGVRGLVCDLGAELGIPFAELSTATVERLNTVLGVGSGVGNPIDIGWGGLSSMETYLETLRALLEDPAVSAVALQEELPKAEFARKRAEGYLAMEALGREHRKPIIFYSRGSYAVTDYGLAFHEESSAPFLQELRRSFTAIASLLSYQPRREAALRTREATPVDQSLAERWRAVLARRREPLPDTQAFELLADFGLAVAPHRLVHGVDEAQRAAEELGLPVALKLSSPGLTHKTEAGGVVVNLRTSDEVSSAASRLLELLHQPAAPGAESGLLVQKMAVPGVELFISCSRDPQFGPVVYLGLGGIWVEVLKEVQLALAPVDDQDARDMIGRLRGHELLRGARGLPAADVPVLAATLARLSSLALALGESLGTIEINPFILGPRDVGGLAVDALVLPAGAGQPPHPLGSGPPLPVGEGRGEGTA